MASFCNISVKDRVTRIGFGLLILLAVMLSWPQHSFVVIAAVMIIEGIVGWCGMATLVDRFYKKP
jgi:hypothetical protein